HGRRTIVEGPQRLTRWGRRFEPLTPFVAGPTQYLVVRFRDGRVSHERGPAVVWMDPVEHAEVKDGSAISLDANESIVVYRADDALITVKLMIFFELMDIEVMLEQTHDPVADFINAVSADVIDFASRLTFEQFKHQTDQLSARETYTQLSQRAGRIGYRINKV